MVTKDRKRCQCKKGKKRHTCIRGVGGSGGTSRNERKRRHTFTRISWLTMLFMMNSSWCRISSRCSSITGRIGFIEKGKHSQTLLRIKSRRSRFFSLTESLLILDFFLRGRRLYLDNTPVRLNTQGSPTTEYRCS